MNRRKFMFGIIGLVIAGGLVLIAINIDHFLEKYEWHKAEKRAEKRYKELMAKFEKNAKLSPMEIGEIAGYFQITSKYDEGIRVLENIRKYSDNYDVYFSLSGLYGYKARTIHLPDEKEKLASISYGYMMEGFRKVPEKPFAYYLRGMAYGVLGCTEKSVEDFNKAIEESKRADKIMFGEGIYIDRQRFVAIVERDIKSYKEVRSNCLLRYAK